MDENIISKLNRFDPSKEFKEVKNFSAIVLAKRRSGKSVLIKDILSYAKDNYKSAHVFSLTAHLQPELFDYVPKGNMYKGLDMERLDAIYNEQQKYIQKELQKKKKKEKCDHVLLIFDDVIADPNIRSNVSGKTFTNLFILGRHINLAVIVLSQYFGGKYGLNAVCRKNCDFIFSFIPSSEGDREILCKEHLSTKSYKHGQLILDQVFNEAYNVLCICGYKMSPNYEDYVYTYKASMDIRKYQIGEDEFHNYENLNQGITKLKGSKYVKVFEQQ